MLPVSGDVVTVLVHQTKPRRTLPLHQGRPHLLCLPGPVPLVVAEVGLTEAGGDVPGLVLADVRGPAGGEGGEGGGEGPQQHSRGQTLPDCG